MITEIIEHKDIAGYIISRGLLKQYKKAKVFILLGRLSQVDFKIREPKKK